MKANSAAMRQSLAWREIFHPLPEHHLPYEVAARLKESSLLYIRNLVDEGLRKGDLRQDLDAGFLSYALYQVTVALRDYLSDRFGFSFRDAVHKATGSPVPDQELLAVLEEMMNLFQWGIASKATTP